MCCATACFGLAVLHPETLFKVDAFCFGGFPYSLRLNSSSKGPYLQAATGKPGIRFEA